MEDTRALLLKGFKKLVKNDSKGPAKRRPTREMLEKKIEVLENQIKSVGEPAKKDVKINRNKHVCNLKLSKREQKIKKK